MLYKTARRLFIQPADVKKFGWCLVFAGGLLLTACGGGNNAATTTATPTATAQMAPIYQGIPLTTVPAVQAQGTTQLDAVRLANQASFGPNDTLDAEIVSKGPSKWIADQMLLGQSSYTTGGDDSPNTTTSTTPLCNQAAYSNNTYCWELWFSSEPLLWDFYRNAVNQPDQLRQRMAFALQQIVVVSGLSGAVTYALRNYQNNLLAYAFGNYRDVLKKVALSPVMGDFLNNVNNPASAPNENFARELMQLFSIGPCLLNNDGTLAGGQCTPSYNNDVVRQYAYALTGWTYPPGGVSPWGPCWPAGSNCPYYTGDMVALPSIHDSNAHTLLNGYTVSANSSPSQALDNVLDSLIHHPNMAPFISKQLIQHFVTSNPSPAYVARVASAFQAGQYQGFGTGTTGDLAATLAAVLLDTEARNPTPSADFGKLREPALFMAGAIRALHGSTDGGPMGWWWGDAMQQHVFLPTTVFSFYPPDYPVVNTALVGPAFGILNSSTGMQRLNYLDYLLRGQGNYVWPDAPATIQATTTVNWQPYLAATNGDASGLVDQLSEQLLGQVLPDAQRAAVMAAAQTSPGDTTAGQQQRALTVAYLILASSQYQVIH